jgi:hypothetical protein
MSADASARRAGRISVRRFASATEADRHDLEFWSKIPEHERVMHVWKLSQELWRLRGDLPDESRLSRSVESVRRR